MRGVNRGGWLEMVDEPGFMLIKGLGGASLLRLVSDVAKEKDCVVICPDGVRVRFEMDAESSHYGYKDCGMVVRGLQRGPWLELVDEPGFMMLASSDGKPLLKAVSPGGTITKWRIAAEAVRVRRLMDDDSEVLGAHVNGSVVIGRRRGVWLQLINASPGVPGFMRLKLTDETPLLLPSA